MKRKLMKILVVCFTLMTMLSLTSCQASPQKEVSKALGIDVASATVESSADSHGGFHGDGVTYIKLNFSDKTFLNKIKQNSAWHSLPLSDNLTTVVYGKSDEQTSIGPFLTDGSGQPLLSQIEHGYFYFNDRHSESKDPQNDSQLIGRSSFNFTLAIYDTDTKTLHFCELDT